MKPTNLLAVILLLCAVAAARGAGLPADVAQRLGEGLPAAFVPLPASGANKIFPLVSDTRRTPDRKYAVTLGETPFVVTAVSDDGKTVELTVPAGLQTTETTNRWFKAEDVFGKVKWRVGAYEPNVACLAYFSGGRGPLELVARIPSGTAGTLLGTVTAGKTALKLVHVAQPYARDGVDAPHLLALVRENPPVTTQAEYDARVKQLMAEHAFREGRPWGKGFPSLLGNTGTFECAAMAADFVTYMVDGGLKTGERFEKADEIRAGDVISVPGHFFAVVSRKGAQLTTIEGNMNESVSRSPTRYSVKDGKLLRGGADAQFEYGYHNWAPPAKKK